MANALVFTTLVLWLSIQAPPAVGVIRLGPAGDRLSADDLAQIARLAKAESGSPWLVVAYPPGPMIDSTRWFVTVFLEPDSWNSALNIGTTLTLGAALSAPGAYEATKTWRVQASGKYAQIPVPGSDPRVVRGARDLNRPFPVVGVIDETALLAIVSLIRGSPTIQPPPSPTRQPAVPILTTVQGHWPITRAVFRNASSVDVQLLDEKASEKSGQGVALRKVGPSWSVSGLTYWIAD
jgi:hypothetical protein